MNSTHRHWTVIAYDSLTKDQKGYKYSCEITFYDVKDEADALKQAKSLVKRKEYLVARITDCISCPRFLDQYHMQESAREMMQKHNEEDV